MKLNSALRPHYAATLRLGIPIAIGQVGVIILGFADTMMVGRYATDALAAAAFVNNLFTLVTFLMMGYSYGLTPLVSASYGRGQHYRAGFLLKSALAERGIELVDTSDPRYFGSSSCEVLDGMHSGEVTALRIVRELTSSWNGLLSYLNMEQCNRLLTEWKGHAAIQQPLLGAFWEQDFLDLQCLKRKPAGLQ